MTTNSNSYAKEYRRKNRDRLRLYNLLPENRIRAKRAEFATKLRDRYGLSVEEYAWIFYNQKGCCAICSRKFDLNNQKVIHIDHCHNTNKVRGLLCANCNQNIIGQIDTKGIDIFTKAFEYLGITL